MSYLWNIFSFTCSTLVPYMFSIYSHTYIYTFLIFCLSVCLSLSLHVDHTSRRSSHHAGLSAFSCSDLADKVDGYFGCFRLFPFPFLEVFVWGRVGM